MSNIPENVDRYEYGLAALEYKSPFTWGTYAALVSTPFVSIILCLTILAPVYFTGLMMTLMVVFYLIIWFVHTFFVVPSERKGIMEIYERNILEKNT